MNHRRAYFAGLLFIVTTLLFMTEGATPAYAVSSNPNRPADPRTASVAPREDSQSFEHQLFAPALANQSEAEADMVVWSSIDNGPVELCWDSQDAGEEVTGMSLERPDWGTQTSWAGVLNVTVDEVEHKAFCTDYINPIEEGCYSNTAVGSLDPLIACSIQHYPPVAGLSDVDAAARQSMIWYFSNDFILDSPADVKTLYDEYIAFIEAEFAAGRCDSQLVDSLSLTIDPTSAANLLVADDAGGFLDSSHDYTVELKKGVLPIANNVVTFTTDLGTLTYGVQSGTTVVATTDANGEATVTITYDNVGEAMITASTVVSLATGVTLDPGADVQDIGLTDYDQYPLEVTATKSWEITPNPAIEIKKYTNGFDADAPFNSDTNVVPTVTPGGNIVWTYVVSNTGNIPFINTSVEVTDNREDIPAAGSVVPVFDSVLSGNDDEFLDPGEIWLYIAEGTALNLPEEEGEHIVEGCLTSQEFSRPTYNNTGTVTVSQYELTDSDPSHYCNLEEPGIEIKKYTNGFDADEPFNSDTNVVPKVTPGGDVVWTYVVSNTGNIPFLAASVIVTDDRGVVVTFVEELVGTDPSVLSPGEIWLFSAEGDALNLIEEEGDHIVAGCLTSQEFSRPTYNNTGTVTVTEYELIDDDPSHYCNPEDPAIEIKKYTNGADADDPNGADVPKVAPTSDIIWTYVVSNTGNIPFLAESVDVTDNRGVAVTFADYLVGDEDEFLEPGEIWLYTGSGDALTLPEEEGDHIVAGCVNSEEISRPTYNNVGTVTVTQYELTDSDPSHYCNPEGPAIEIKKYTNGADADNPNGADVPKISPAGDIVWTYVVSNTGNIPFPAESVDVTDNRGVVVTFADYLVGNEDALLEPGEIWLYTGSGEALTLVEEDGDHIVNGCLNSEEVSRPTYNNVGTVTVTEYALSDSDPSHYCNPEEQEPELAALGDRVWYDENENGVQDDGEPDVPGVTVTLYNCSDVQVGTPLVTDENGLYLFTNLEPGCYYVVFDPETLPDDYSFTTPNANGVNDAEDSDANQSTGKTPSVTLSAGETNLTLDAGIVERTIVITATPLCENDAPKLQYSVQAFNFTPGENPVTIRWIDVETDEVLYEFTNLPLSGTVLWPEAGVDENGVGNQWPGWTFEDGKWVDNGSPLRPQVRVEIVVNPTETVTVDYPPATPTCSTSPRAALGNRVWIDENENGAQDEGEPDVPGVTVTLFNCADEQVGEPLVTDENGEYLFDNLVPGCYYVVFDPETLPDEFTFTTQNAEGVDDALDSDPDPENGRTQTVTLGGGEVNLDLDAGLLPDAPPPTNLPGGPQPNQQSMLFLPSLGN